MLKKIGEDGRHLAGSIDIAAASFPEPFYSGLEYSSPARGTWNIVHTGMLVPGGHQIYVCAAGCIRGVVLTAAEMGAMERFSTIAIREDNVISGDIEELMIEGITDILRRLPAVPPAVLVFNSCIHYFLGCDMELVYRELRARFSTVAFADCTMNPIMRKSGLTPDQSCRKQIYSFLQPRPRESRAVNIIGSDLPTLPSSELVRLIASAGWILRDITQCRTYEEYQAMAEASLNIYYQPMARFACEDLAVRLGQQLLYVPLSYDYDEITAALAKLAVQLGAELPDYQLQIDRCEAALASLRELFGDTPIAIDYTATFRPFSLARLLVKHGLNVERIYTDVIAADDEADFYWLQAQRPHIQLFGTVQPVMRLLPRHTAGKLVAVGQKAAYFCGTDYFVNIVESGGLYGFDGILRMVELLKTAFLQPKDARMLIQQKGWGCDCCL